MQAHRPSLDAVGTWLFVVVVVGVALSIGFSFAMNAAADDLRGQARIASSLPPEQSRTPWGTWLAARIAADVTPSEFAATLERADQLDHRADRIRELAGAAALGGLVLMLVTARPETRAASERARSNPVASTRSNGTV